MNLERLNLKGKFVEHIENYQFSIDIGYLIRMSQICIKIEFENEYPWKLFLLGHWYWKYKFFHSNPLFSSSPGFLTVLHLPSTIQRYEWKLTCGSTRLIFRKVPSFSSALVLRINISLKWQYLSTSTKVQNSCCLFITRSRLKSRRKILGAFCKVTSFIFNFIDRELYPNLGFKIDGECGQQWQAACLW